MFAILTACCLSSPSAWTVPADAPSSGWMVDVPVSLAKDTPAASACTCGPGCPFGGVGCDPCLCAVRRDSVSRMETAAANCRRGPKSSAAAAIQPMPEAVTSAIMPVTFQPPAGPAVASVFLGGGTPAGGHFQPAMMTMAAPPMFAGNGGGGMVCGPGGCAPSPQMAMGGPMMIGGGGPRVMMGGGGGFRGFFGGGFRGGNGGGCAGGRCR